MDDYRYIENTGLIVPQTAEIITEVQNDFKDAFGEDLIVTSDTPQGVLIAAETIARAQVVQNNAALANQINPNVAGGVYLDGICALTGLQRQGETHSHTLVDLTGIPGTVIPAGVTIKNADSILFQSTAIVTLDVNGIASVEFQAVDTGPIPAPANTLNIIVNGVLGWETANNPNDAVLGSTTQSDQSLRELRRVTLAGQGTSIPEAIISALNKIPDVKSITFRENITSSVLIIDGVTMQPHSMYACVDGGTDEEVANVLLEKKSGGCGYSNGAGIPVTVDVVEPASGQTYPVSFDRPDLIPVLIRATVSPGGSVANPIQAVKDAILAYIDGEIEGETGFTIGTDVSCFELGGAINKVYPSIFVVNIETTLAPPNPISYSNATIPISVFEKATADTDSISVVIV